MAGGLLGFNEHQLHISLDPGVLNALRIEL